MNRLKRLWLLPVLFAALAGLTLAGGNIVTNSGMKDNNGDRLPDGWIGESLLSADRVVCHNQCWWRFSLNTGSRALTQRIYTTLPTYTDIKLQFVLQASEIPYNSAVEVDIYSGAVLVERALLVMQHQSGKQTIIFRVAKTGDSVLIKILNEGGMEWKLRGLKIKPPA